MAYYLISNIYNNKKQIFFISDGADWVIIQEGLSLKRGVREVAISITPYFLKNKVIHFGSIHALSDEGKLKKIKRSNAIIVSWFHVVSGVNYINKINAINKYVDRVHVSCDMTKNEIIKLGVNKNKIVKVPIPIRTDTFKPAKSVIDSHKLRKALGIADDELVIGSFQKDGRGWGNGAEPKLVKGPDILCEVLEKLNKKYKIHVLLTGPARGYVKKRLMNKNIKFTHHFLSKYAAIAKYYRALDAYVVTSRVEGGPKAILESMASGVPIVSTQVGMAPEIVRNGYNGFLNECDDVNGIVANVSRIIETPQLRQYLVRNALMTSRKYDVKKIGSMFYTQLYLPLLKQLNNRQHLKDNFHETGWLE